VRLLPDRHRSAEPGRPSRAATVTGVARDDLDDGGAWLYAETIRRIHELNPGTGVEILVPDFNGDPERLAQVFAARPEVFAHNVETVPRIFKRIRPAFTFERSLDVITQGHDAGLVTKSNLILGMGEERDEVIDALERLREAHTDIVTLTQYLRPSPRHLPVARWVHPDEFVDFREIAEDMGFSGVLAGPLVRSSYRAGRLWARATGRCRGLGRRYWVSVMMSVCASRSRSRASTTSPRSSPMPRIRFDFVTRPAS
jgi:lipoic acid synthetase